MSLVYSPIRFLLVRNQLGSITNFLCPFHDSIFMHIYYQNSQHNDVFGQRCLGDKLGVKKNLTLNSTTVLW